MQQWYSCPRCRQYIQHGQLQCHNCGAMISWAQPSQQKQPAYSRSFNLGIVGESFNNDDGSSRQEILRRCTVGEPIQLIHHPHPKDKNAVRVCRANGEQIGWISQSQSVEFASILKRGEPISAQIAKILDGYPINCVLQITKYSDKPFKSMVSPVTKNTGANSIWKIVAFVFLFIIFLVFTTNMQGVFCSKPAAVEPVINISANDLAAEYEANEIAADLKYKGKRLKVAGIISSMGTDIIGSPYVILETNNAIRVQCVYPNTQEYKTILAKLVKGQNAYVTGICKGVVLIDVLLDHE